jgi:hypothetical protein
MAGDSAPKLGGLIVTLALSAVITVGAVIGAAVGLWPGGGASPKPGAPDPGLEMFANTASRLAGFIFFTYPDEVKDYMSPVLADLKEKMPGIKSVVVTDQAGLIVGSDKEDEIDKNYQLPKGAKPVPADKLDIQPLEGGTTLVAVPAVYNNKVKGFMRIQLAVPQAKGGAGGGKSLVLIIGLAAMLLGLVVPIAAVPAMTKKLSAAPAAASVSDAKLKAIKAEEASIMTRLDSLKRELGKAEEMRTQQAELAEQVNSLRQQQTEENTKLEELKREVMELGSQLEQRRQLLEAPPDERQAQLTQQDRELLQKIIDHKKEELALAKKIQEIRRKVVELEKRTKA